MLRYAPLALTAALTLHAATGPSAPSPQAPSAAAARAAAARLTAARTAIGGDAKVLALKTLRLTGTEWSSQAVRGGYTEDTEVPLEFRFAFPDRFLKATVFPFGPVQELVDGFDGTRLIMTRNGKPGVNAAAGEAYNRRTAAELILGILARTEPWAGLTLEPDGASAIRIHGPQAYTSRVEFDPATHLPVRLIYKERRQVRTPNTASRRGTAPAGSSGAASTGGSGRSTTELPEVEITITFQDRQDVSGFQIPRRITWRASGIDLWEYRFEKIVVNAPMTAADFGG